MSESLHGYLRNPIWDSIYKWNTDIKTKINASNAVGHALYDNGTWTPMFIDANQDYVIQMKRAYGASDYNVDINPRFGVPKGEVQNIVNITNDPYGAVGYTYQRFYQHYDEPKNPRYVGLGHFTERRMQTSARDYQ